MPRDLLQSQTKARDENDDENPFTKALYCSGSDVKQTCYKNLIYAKDGNDDDDIEVESLQQYINLFCQRKTFNHASVK